MKKLALTLVLAIICTTIFSANVIALEVGDPIGDVLYSDVMATINGSAIPTSVIKGKTLVVVEDLAGYGFDVSWSNKERSLRVEHNSYKPMKPLKVTRDVVNKPGTFKQNYFYTDIKTYLSGEIVESYAINGRTLIDFESLAKYGELNWNNSTRVISLTLPVYKRLSESAVGDIVIFGNYKWRVLDVQSGKVLVISESIIENREYGYNSAGVTWENSDIRKYLNGDFLAGFYPDERAKIIETRVVNSKGNETTDKIFLLSVDEAKAYFNDDADRIAYNANGKSDWWLLRSPDNEYGVMLYYVTIDGSLDDHGAVNHLGGIRPAMWLTLE